MLSSHWDLSDHCSCEDNGTSKNAKIIIIGSGCSGIAAAAKLLENGFNNVTILEAEDRIGGRIYTTKFGNYYVDIGAQWVHGEHGNIIFEMANPLGLLDVSNEPDFGYSVEFMDSAGILLDEELSEVLDDFFDNHVANANFEEHPGYENVGQYVEKAFDERFKDHPAILNDKEKYMFHYELVKLQNEAAESWYEISVPGLPLYKSFPGDPSSNWKERGFSTILDLLLKRYPNPENEIPVVNNTIINTEVTLIDYTNKAVGSPVSITTVNGQMYKADHVIVTVSIGVLKDRHKSLFIPSLPDYKVNAIEAIGFGGIAKILILFDKPFLTMGDSRTLCLNFLWNNEERKEIEADPERNWLLGMAEAATMEHRPNLLSLWVTGKYVKAMEALPEETVFKHSVENLHRFLGKTYNLSTPIAMLRSRWHSNPHFKGTYSYRSPETEKRQAFPEMLERPLNEQTLRVLFAGEATAVDRFSTVDGAIHSGWIAADRLINHYKN